MKLVRKTALAIACTLILVASGHAKSAYVSVDRLPEMVKTFVAQQFPNQQIIFAEKEGHFYKKAKYELGLDSGAKLALDEDGNWEKVVASIRELLGDEDLIILPQVFGLKDTSVLDKIRTALPARVAFVGTMPPSVPGIRTQMLLKRRFEVLGGTFLMGDEVTSAALHEGVVSSVTTRNLDTARLFADHFILASGGYFSKGLTATPTQVYEPLFGLDIDYPAERKDWYDPDFFAAQPFMDFGVKTDASLHGIKDGEPVKNLFCIGSVLGSTRKEDFGTAAGLAIRTAFAAVDTIKGGNV